MAGARLRAKPRRGTPGATLLEVMVAMAIGSILMTVLVTILVQGGRLLERLGDTTTMRSSATTTLYRISQEFKQSSWSTATVVTPATPPDLPGSTAFTALSFRLADSSQTQSFVGVDSFIVYYMMQPSSGTSTLMRKTWPVNTATVLDPVPIVPDPFANNLHLRVDDLSSIITTPNGSEQIMVRNVSSWAITPAPFPGAIPAGGSPPAPVLTMDLACVLPVTHPPAITGAWHSAVLPRNP